MKVTHRVEIDSLDQFPEIRRFQGQAGSTILKNLHYRSMELGPELPGGVQGPDLVLVIPNVISQNSSLLCLAYELSVKITR